MDFEKYVPLMKEVAMQGGNIAAIIGAIDEIEKQDYVVKYAFLFVQAFKLTISQALKLDNWIGGGFPMLK